MAQSFTSLYAHSEWKNQRLTAEEIRDALVDFELFASLHYIPDKNKKMVRFKLNEPQRDFAHRILQAAFGQEPGKEEPKTFVVLKSRRIGITFVCILLEQYIAMRKRNLSVVHLFPNNTTSQILFDTSVKEIYSGTHPQLLADNTYVSTGGGEVRISKFMGTDINSTVMYSSFNTDRRGTGFQILMLDEWAMATNPSDVERIFVNTVPKTGFAILVFISCVTKDTLILPDTGMEEIGEHPDGYSPADKNLYGLGGNHHADQYYGTGLVPTKKIRTKAGFEIECTPNHRLWTVDGWKRADEFKPGDRIDIQLGQQQFGNYVCDDFVKRPYKKGFKANDIDLTLDDDLAYLCGLVVAEGSWSDTYVDITIGDKEVHDWLVKRWGATKQRKDSKFHYRISSVHLVDFINWLGIRKLAKNKNIPAKVMKWPKRFQAAFISGMFDGDGCANRGRQRISYTTASDTLAKQLQVVLLNYGIFSRRHITHVKSHNIGDRVIPASDVWTIEITHSMARLFAKEIGFRLGRKQQIAESYSADGERAGGYDRHFNRADLGTLPTKYGYISRCKTIKSDTYDSLPNKPYYDGMAADYIESVEDSFANCYDFCVPETHSYFSNGFVSHNTAKGVNHFYDLCELAQKPDSGMEFLFYPWHEVWWNQLPPKKEVSELDTLTPEEAKLVYIFKEKGYPPETWLPKLAFFQDLERKNSGDMEKILSEWPATAEEAFTNTGKPVFPVKKLRKLYDKAKDAKFDYIDIVPEVDDLGRRNGRVTWGTVEKSCIKQYKGPEHGHRYIIGIDPSSGLEESDYTAMVVVDEKTLETVATFYGRVEPDDSATIAVSLAKLYNMAVIVPESNMGEALIGAIVNIGYPRLAADPKSSKDHPRYGIRTTVDSKEEGIARMRFFLLRNMWKTTDIQFVDDALHFQYTSTPSGRQKAEAVGRNNETNEPYHDDMVMANIMVCLYLNMQRWRDYYIYVDGNPNKMQRLATVAKGTFVLHSNQMETPRNVVIRNYGRRIY